MLTCKPASRHWRPSSPDESEGTLHGWRISICRVGDILSHVTKRLIDVDDVKLEKVRKALGTATIKATIDAALDEVLHLVARREALLTERDAATADLAARESRRAAWG